MEVTKAEASKIWRRRFGLYQHQVSKSCARWERGEHWDLFPPGAAKPLPEKDYSLVPLPWAMDPRPLSEGEFLQTLRNRYDESLRDAAARLTEIVGTKRSHQYVIEIEQDQRRDRLYVPIYSAALDAWVSAEARAMPYDRAAYEQMRAIADHARKPELQ